MEPKKRKLVSPGNEISGIRSNTKAIIDNKMVDQYFRWSNRSQLMLLNL